MNDKLAKESIELNNGATNENIHKIREYFGKALSDEFIKLLEFSDGISTDDGLVIFDTKSIIERNETYEVAKYAPGYIAIGNDGGDILYLINASESGKIYLVGCGDLNVNNGRTICKSLIDFIYEFSEEENDVEKEPISDFCSIVLCAKPENGLKGLLELKKELSLDISAKELLEMTNRLPVVIKDNIRVGAAKSYLKNLPTYTEILKIV